MTENEPTPTHVPEMDNPMPPKARIFADRDGTLYAQGYSESLWLHAIPDRFPQPNTPCGFAVSFDTIQLKYGPLRELRPLPTVEASTSAVGITAEAFDEAAEKMRQGAIGFIGRPQTTPLQIRELLDALRAELFGPPIPPVPTEPGFYLANDGSTWVLEGLGSLSEQAPRPWTRVAFPNGRLLPGTSGWSSYLSNDEVARFGPFTRLVPERGAE